jgi:hypothetical protein
MFIKLFFVLLFLFLFANDLFAKGVYQTSDEFLQSVFTQSIPKTKMLWMTGKVKKTATRILGERPGQLRVRYWRVDNKTAWILEAIGKEKLITVGFVIEDNKLQLVNVLTFRESRGWEVKESFFLEQFDQAQLNSNLQLDRSIDGISGATLSVRVLRKLSRLALFYHQSVLNKDPKG